MFTEVAYCREPEYRGIPLHVAYKDPFEVATGARLTLASYEMTVYVDVVGKAWIHFVEAEDHDDHEDEHASPQAESVQL